MCIRDRDKIRIKGLRQGTKSLEGGFYSVGFVTKWGIVWVAPPGFTKFRRQNPHLKELFYVHDGYIEGDDFIGRYIYVTNKANVRRYEDQLIVGPIL